jgi:hypothetical protein
VGFGAIRKLVLINIYIPHINIFVMIWSAGYAGREEETLLEPNITYRTKY